MRRDPHLTWHVSLPFPPVSIQIVSTSNASQTVTLVYVVGNRSSFLNGTVASSLLRQLSAELVGFYLTYPPLTIAEPLEYPNLDISETTRDYWVITVLQGVDNSLVGLHNQSFARVMEQRLAQLFMMSQQQGRRFKRATTLGSYTVQVVPASDEEEGAVLFDNSGKAAADPFDTSSGSVQLIAVKPTALPVVHPTSDRSQESAALNGE
ncbi:UPF0606 protein KIAA1549L-like, partial [Leptonychotes weddellii]|uniref:UPF0606 protein KIAA1549L-like n=1 Tax=Leptonychotes weddellii TaxID=9713 RepID=A0A7F8QAJ8_LEPWE